jgi:uncharacterized protein (TIGR00730 family)
VRIAVFTGSQSGPHAHREAAAAFATDLATAGVGIVYGGGHVGLMGVVADAALEAGGEVIGILPRALQAREIGHLNLTSLEVVETMHERKARMAELSDAFIALPGGVGTLEEVVEAMTWTMLGIHLKPVGLLSVNSYYAPLEDWLDRSREQGFLKPEHRELLMSHEDPEVLVSRLEAWEPVHASRWTPPVTPPPA